MSIEKIGSDSPEIQAEVNEPNKERLENKVELNNRQKKMLELLNGEIESDYPLTEEGYNDAGRSAGVLEKIAKTEIGRKIWKRYFLSISRKL